MELKTIIYVTGNMEQKYLCNDEKSLRECLSAFLPDAYTKLSHRPILVLERGLRGVIDGYHIISLTHPQTLPFYIADECRFDNGNLYVSNGITGKKDNNISTGYTVINRKGQQLYPPVNGNQQTALEKFIRNSFDTKYVFTKQDTKQK